ncbi:hypothetical protein EV356DRAFT_578818 [Viridothelium virens]|uniref:Rhodopsin domain-containing protein n=1 Tax=Viridothelium virens TaxID=1048519 RepID=A0A6A6H1N1_VIRVR|nr:hypothetical protein EV356DRAFT_578818 [Viridothelium virens]
MVSSSTPQSSATSSLSQSERSAGGIHEVAFKVLIWLFYAVATTTALFRAVIQLRKRKRFDIDDCLVIFGWMPLTAATAVLSWGVSSIYEIESVETNPANIQVIGSNFLPLLNTCQIVYHVFITLTWATIISVKFAFLYFFRQLVRQLPRLRIYWIFTIATTTVVSVYCLAISFITCPYTGSDTMKCYQSTRLRVSLAIGYITITVDILTDLMIVAIPVYLIWVVKMKPKRKLGLALFLCLQVSMAITAIVRVSGPLVNGSSDLTWNFFWQQMEACFAITMVSLTAFRSVFASDGSRAGNSKTRKPWYNNFTRQIRPSKQSQASHGREGLPSIPTATLSGMRTFIRGGNDMSQYDSFHGRCSDEQPIIPQESHIKVAHLSGAHLEEV